jgi:transcriptional regulator with XRE-family HTH domain
MSESKRYLQHKVLGNKLRMLREQNHESLAEVSGAVEIDVDQLERIEKGMQRPTEDILLLLLSHLDAQEEEAVRLWELAGYENPDSPSSNKSVYMLVAPDSRVIYTDVVDVAVNKHGVVLNFQQFQGADKPLTVSRMGMSHQHAQGIIDALQRSLDAAQQPPKALPAPKGPKAPKAKRAQKKPSKEV